MTNLGLPSVRELRTCFFWAWPFLDLHFFSNGLYIFAKLRCRFSNSLLIFPYFFLWISFGTIQFRSRNWLMAAVGWNCFQLRNTRLVKGIMEYFFGEIKLLAPAFGYHSRLVRENISLDTDKILTSQVLRQFDSYNSSVQKFLGITLNQPWDGTNIF